MCNCCLSVPCAAKGFVCYRCCSLQGFCFVPTQASKLQQLYMCWPEQPVVFGVRDGCVSMLGGMLTVVYIHSCVGACWACLQPRQAFCVLKGREWQQAAQRGEFACTCCMAACAPVSMGAADMSSVCSTAEVLGAWALAGCTHTQTQSAAPALLSWPEQHDYSSHAWPSQQQWFGFVRHARVLSACLSDSRAWGRGLCDTSTCVSTFCE